MHCHCERSVAISILYTLYFLYIEIAAPAGRQAGHFVPRNDKRLYSDIGEKGKDVSNK